MNDDKLLRLMQEAGIQQWDDDSDQEECNITDSKVVAFPGDGDPVAFYGDLDTSMNIGLHGPNAASFACLDDTEVNADCGDVAFAGQDGPPAFNTESENNHLLNFTTGFYEDAELNTNNNSAVNDHSHFIINPETGILEHILEEEISDASHRLQLINPTTGILENYENFEPAEDDKAKRGKKRKRDPATWDRNKNKTKYLKDHVMRAIPPCRCKCTNKLNESECKEIFSKFINLANHTEQNIYLQGCLIDDVPHRFRPRKNSKNIRNRRVLKYNLKTCNRTITVCQQIFLAIHGIQRDRLRRKVMHREKDIQDGRGKHNNHPTCQQETIEKVNRFLTNLPARESHYSRSSNKHKKYLDSHLSVAELHRKFLKDNPGNQIKYDKFREIFNFDFNYAFGQPRKDICHTCEKLKFKIDAARACNNQEEKETLERDHELHLRKAQVFLERLSTAAKLNEKDETKMILCFDYQKNLE